MDYRSRPRRASEWLIELSEHPADLDLRHRFEDWLAADPANARDWAEIERTYAAIGQTVPVYRSQWVGRQVDAEMPDRPRRHSRPSGARHFAMPSRRRAAAGIVAAALAACLALVVVPDLATRLSADAVTGTAEVTSLTLADGSTVRLAPETAISVTLTDRERTVRLIEGAAFFEVTPDPPRPFRVDAGGLQATVLGTAFEVSLNEHARGVAVQEGVVQVTATDRRPLRVERLGAGQTAVLSDQGDLVRGRIAPDQVAAWRDGLLIANDRPVGEVVEELRPFYRGVVVLSGDRLAAQPLTGVYSLSDPVSALDAIAGAQGATVIRLSPWVTIMTGN